MKNSTTLEGFTKTPMLCTLALGFLLACGSPAQDGEKKAPAKKSKAETPKNAASVPAAAAATTGGPCSEYAAKVCAAAGDKSTTCTSFKSSVDLMPEAACKAGLAEIATTTAKISAAQAVCADLVKRLCAAIGPDSKTCAMVSERTKAFPPERCKQMGSPAEFPKVVQSLEQMEAANKPLDAAKRAKIEGPDGASFGAKNAKVTVVEFSDFECPYCTRAADAVTEIKKKYGDKVRVVFRHFPLSFHKNAHLASQASLFANSKGKFWEFHDLLFKNQKAMGRDSLVTYAKQLGLNVNAFNKALTGGTYKAAVDADIELGKSVAVQGTPTMFVNGARVQNPTDINMISKDIDAALAAQ
jgi:protein-disulfide isomerase